MAQPVEPCEGVGAVRRRCAAITVDSSTTALTFGPDSIDPNPKNRYTGHNGSECVRRAMNAWVYAAGVRLDFIRHHHVRPHSSLRDAVPADRRRTRCAARAAATRTRRQRNLPPLTPRAPRRSAMDADAPPNERLSREPNRNPILLTELETEVDSAVQYNHGAARPLRAMARPYKIPAPQPAQGPTVSCLQPSERLCTTTASREEISWASL